MRLLCFRCLILLNYLRDHSFLERNQYNYNITLSEQTSALLYSKITSVHPRSPSFRNHIVDLWNFWLISEVSDSVISLFRDRIIQQTNAANSAQKANETKAAGKARIMHHTF